MRGGKPLKTLEKLGFEIYTMAKLMRVNTLLLHYTKIFYLYTNNSNSHSALYPKLT
jgi:hypothetical protein